MNPPAKSFKDKVKSIDKEDLNYVEGDLKYYEKVSVAFLLFGNQAKQNIIYAVQKLLIMSNSQEDASHLLYDYASIMGDDDDWKWQIVEALAIIQANRVVRKLGFNKSEIYETLLPHVCEISKSLHPMLKTLYKVCESLSDAETGKMRLELDKNSTLRFYDSAYLEIFLLDWMSKDIISIGDATKKTAPDLDILIEYFKFNDKIGLYDLLLSGIKHFNDNLRLRSRNVNDSALSHYSGDIARGTSFDKKESVDFGELPNPLSYKICSETAGYILIINIMEFTRETDQNLQHLLPSKKLERREGSKADEVSLITTFSQFGYKPVVKPDLKHYEITSTISDFAKRSAVYDSLIVAILTHGAEGVVYGSNSIPVEVSRIKSLLAADELLDKPKILIVQACQGSELQEARVIPSNEETDGPSQSASELADMLVVMSTVPGFAAIRHKIEGTWFIQSICKQVAKCGDKMHMCDILTRVFQEVQSKRGCGNQCMVPIFSTTFKKSLYLPKIV